MSRHWKPDEGLDFIANGTNPFSLWLDQIGLDFP